MWTECRGIQGGRGSCFLATRQLQRKRMTCQHAGPRRDDTDGSENPFLAGQEQPFEKEERRALVWIALKAALLLGGVFVLAAFLFLLFCVNVWFK